jgi:hypothetical protein
VNRVGRKPGELVPTAAERSRSSAQPTAKRLFALVRNRKTCIATSPFPTEVHESGALETAYESRLPFDDEGDESVQEDESVVLTEEAGWDGVVLSGRKRTRRIVTGGVAVVLA